MKSEYESFETRRFQAAKSKADAAAADAGEAKAQAQAAVDQASQALAIVDDPNGPVQQAISDAAQALDEAAAAVGGVADAQAAADAALLEASEAKTTADGKNKIYRIADAADIPDDALLNPGDLMYYISPETFGSSSEHVLAVYIWNGEAWVINQLVATSVIVPGTVGAVQIADGAITTPKLEAGSVVTEKLAAGSVVTDKIAARAITASKMILGDNSNLVPDPTLEAPFGEGWYADDAWTIRELSGYDGNGAVANPTGTAGNLQEVHSSEFAVTPGDEFLVRARTLAGDSFDGAFSIGMRFYDSDGNEAGRQTQSALGTDWTPTILEVTTPSTARTARFRAAIASATTGLAAFSSPQILRRSNGELIVDGAITAGKIRAGEVTASKLASESVTAEKIAAGAVTARSMTIGDFTNLVDDPDFQHPDTSWNLDGGIGVVDTTGGPGKALRWIGSAGRNYGWNMNVFPVKEGEEFLLTVRVQNKLDTNFIVGVQFLNESQVSINKSSSLNIGDSSWTDRTLNVTVPSDAFYGRFYAASANGTSSGNAWMTKPRLLRRATGELIVNGAITANKLSADAIDGKTITGVTINGGEFKTVPNTSFGGQAHVYNLNGRGTVRLSAELGAQAPGKLAYLRGGGTGPAANASLEFVGPGSGSGTGEAIMDWTHVRFRDQNVPLRQGIGNSGLFYENTTAGGGWSRKSMRVANILSHVDGSSLRSLKRDIRDHASHSLLDLQYRSWVDGDSSPAGITPPPDGIRRVGAVAEEMQKLAPELCTYDEEGNLVGIAYDRVAVALIPFLRDLTNRVEALEGTSQTVWPESPDYTDDDEVGEEPE